MNKWKSLAAGALLALSGLAASSAQAAIINFDGVEQNTLTPVTIGDYELSGPAARIVNGQCGVDKPCLALNRHEETQLNKVDDSPFTLEAFWFYLSGEKTELTVTTDKGANVVYKAPTYEHNTGYVIDLTGNALFEDIRWVKFDNTEPEFFDKNGKLLNATGNVRIDDLVVSTVPVPAAGWLMVAALGGMVAMRRRKTAA